MPDGHSAIDEAISVILDTDMWGDIDDALALAALHTLQNGGEADIRAITCSTSDPSSVTFIDVVNTYFQHSDIPIGMVTNGVRPPLSWRGDGQTMIDGSRMYTDYISGLGQADGLVFPRRLKSDDKIPEAVSVMREALSTAADSSVVMIDIGFNTNFARLLASQPDDFSPLHGSDLVTLKFHFLSMMACAFEDVMYRGESTSKTRKEYNILHDISSAQTVFQEWPTPIVVSPFELGFSLRLNEEGIAASLEYDQHHPILLTYRYMDETYRGPGSTEGALHDHKTFDLDAVLYAIRPYEDYF